jgi:hypothetical protein
MIRFIHPQWDERIHIKKVLISLGLLLLEATLQNERSILIHRSNASLPQHLFLEDEQ